VNKFDPEKGISQYIKIRDYIKAQDDAHATRMKPYKQGLIDLANALALYAKEQNLSVVKTLSGSAFPTEQLRVKCSDRDTFLEFVFSNNARQFLTAHVSKEAVRDFMNLHDGTVPPGLETDKFIEWQVRRG
jgi:hypothetical protein